MSLSYSNIDVDETEDQVSAVAVDVRWLHVINLDSTPVYLKLYNGTAADVVVGTTVPQHTFAVPSQGDANGAGFTLAVEGLQFTAGLTVAATTGVAVADTTGPGTNELILNLGYNNHI